MIFPGTRVSTVSKSLSELQISGFLANNFAGIGTEKSILRNVLLRAVSANCGFLQARNAF
jgi:hypothetical protein